MIRAALMFSALGLSACMGAPLGQPVGPYPDYQPRPGQGQYVRPAYLNAVPPPRIPVTDPCRSRLYAGLVGQHEGSIYLAGLPGDKRIVKPAVLEGFGYNPTEDFYDEPPFVEVREYIAGQVVYAPSVRATADRLSLQDDNPQRLTIELDADGYVREIDCG
jgi:hypothetical protein